MRLAYAKDQPLPHAQSLGMVASWFGDGSFGRAGGYDREPRNGLDPSGIVEMRAFLQELNRDKGITIVISSHHLADSNGWPRPTRAFLKQGLRGWWSR